MMVMKEHNGIYISLEELIQLEYIADGFSFLPKQPIHSVLGGRHASRLRGRGLNFEELRGYLPGDDIRNIDWKVTARTQKPYVRVYTEEKERPALIICDQRMPMFFGTKKEMKSVTAAKLAALASWRILKSDDRVGGIVFNDSDITEHKPQRSRSHTQQLLKSVSEYNNELKVSNKIKSNPDQLNEVLDNVVRIAKHDYLIILISDFYGLNDKSNKYLLSLAEHNDVLAFLIYDPIAVEMPEDGKYVLSENELQVELNMNNKKVHSPISNFTTKRLSDVDTRLKKIGIPIFRINNSDDIGKQLRTHFGNL
ncbi:MAG: DUF58 domain-containing protein [Bacteroidota bacterium]